MANSYITSPAFLRNAIAAASVSVVIGIGIYSTFTKLTPSGASSSRYIHCFATSSGGNVLCVTETGTLSGTVINLSSSPITFTETDPRYVNVSGDTMTGALAVQSNLSGSTVNISDLKSCDTIDTDGDGLLACGTDADTTYTAGQGLTLNGTVITLSSSFSGTNVTLTGTLSGSALKMSSISPRCIVGQISGSGQTLATGSGKNAFNVPSIMSGYTLRFAEMGVGTAGATNATSVQARLIRGSTTIGKMFSTPVSVDSAEWSSTTAATPAVINFSAATVQGGDVIQFDVPAVSTTPPKIVQLTQCFFAP